MKNWLIVFCLTTYSLVTKAQDVKVYHGSNGKTSVMYSNGEKVAIGKSIIKPLNNKVTIEILNPNPLFYTYEFKSEDLEVKEDFPDISSLMSILNPLLENANSSVRSTVQESNRLRLKGKERYLAEGDPLFDYQNKLNDLEIEIKTVQGYIKESDVSESKEEAIAEGNKTAGLEYAQKKVRLMQGGQYHFNSTSLLADLNALVDKFQNDPKLGNKFFKAYNETIVKTIDNLKDQINTVKNVISYSVIAGEKLKKIKLVIKKKGNISDLGRDEIDEEILIVESEFNRRILEVIPVANFVYAADTYNFGLTNGTITKVDNDGWRLKPGAMLVYYPVLFGKYKDGALGFGAGFNVPKDKSVLDNFFIGSILSYRNTFRVGLGWGFAEYPAGLKNDLQEGATLPQNVNNIEDLVLYDRRGAVFLTFSFLGLSLLSK